MRLTEIAYDDSKPIDGYGPGFFRIGGELVEGPVVLSAEGLAAWGGLDDLGPLLNLPADVIFIGTGAEPAYLPAALRAGLEEAGVAFEAMASPAACRTYNVLLSEGRRVAAALLPV